MNVSKIFNSRLLSHNADFNNKVALNTVRYYAIEVSNAYLDSLRNSILDRISGTKYVDHIRVVLDNIERYPCERLELVDDKIIEIQQVFKNLENNEQNDSCLGESLLLTRRSLCEMVVYFTGLYHLYKRNKFSFIHYKGTIQDKLEEEDEFALKILNSFPHIKIVIDFAAQISCYLKQKDVIFNFEQCKRFFLGKIGWYPVSKIWNRLTNTSELIDFIETSSDHIILLSVLWYLPAYLCASNQIASYAKVDYIYNTAIITARDHSFGPMDAKLSYSFGNSKTLINPFFGQGFFPFGRSVDYIKINCATTNNKVKQYIEKKIPYISGSSGMANTASSIFLLPGNKHDIISEKGKMFAEAMCAFIVGSGMHSYQEVYASFNLTMKHIYYGLDIDVEP